jgi:hypothetical protein
MSVLIFLGFGLSHLDGKNYFNICNYLYKKTPVSTLKCRWFGNQLCPPRQQQLRTRQPPENPASLSHSSRILLSISTVQVAAAVWVDLLPRCRHFFPHPPPLPPHSKPLRLPDFLPQPPAARPSPQVAVITTTNQTQQGPTVHRPFLLLWCQVPVFLMPHVQPAGKVVEVMGPAAPTPTSPPFLLGRALCGSIR